MANLASVANYRPISVLPTVSRLFEKVLYGQLYQYLDENKLLYLHQSGFRSLHSCVTCLLKSTNDWYTDIDRGNVNAVVFIDLKKAFDTVDHSILLEKLSLYGIRGIELEWFRSYLSGRQQYCKVNGHISNIESIRYGVPQGSCLGPLLRNRRLENFGPKNPPIRAAHTGTFNVIIIIIIIILFNVGNLHSKI